MWYIYQSEPHFIDRLLTSSQRVCPSREGEPPGTCIYSKGGDSIYEVDGEEHKVRELNHTLSMSIISLTRDSFSHKTCLCLQSSFLTPNLSSTM